MVLKEGPFYSKSLLLVALGLPGRVQLGAGGSIWGRWVENGPSTSERGVVSLVGGCLYSSKAQSWPSSASSAWTSPPGGWRWWRWWWGRGWRGGERPCRRRPGPMPPLCSSKHPARRGEALPYLCQSLTRFFSILNLNQMHPPCYLSPCSASELCLQIHPFCSLFVDAPDIASYHRSFFLKLQSWNSDSSFSWDPLFREGWVSIAVRRLFG